MRRTTGTVLMDGPSVGEARSVQSDHRTADVQTGPIGHLDVHRKRSVRTRTVSPIVSCPMPLIDCPDCAKPVSDAAPSCPNCGRPFGACDDLISPEAIVSFVRTIIEATLQPLRFLSRSAVEPHRYAPAKTVLMANALVGGLFV